jgi:hypothetical protein
VSWCFAVPGADARYGIGLLQNPLPHSKGESTSPSDPGGTHTDDEIWFLPVVAIGFVTSQVAAMDTVEVRHLWLVSTLLGLAYGSLFNVLPMLVLEWFGMGRSSEHPRHGPMLISYSQLWPGQ